MTQALLVVGAHLAPSLVVDPLTLEHSDELKDALHKLLGDALTLIIVLRQVACAATVFAVLAVSLSCDVDFILVPAEVFDLVVEDSCGLGGGPLALTSQASELRLQALHVLFVASRYISCAVFQLIVCLDDFDFHLGLVKLSQSSLGLHVVAVALQVVFGLLE